MALTIVRDDITRMQVDAIVNSTNERLCPGGTGVRGAPDYGLLPLRGSGALTLAPTVHRRAYWFDENRR